MADFNDEPISSPSEDKFGIDPFAKTIAKCIENLRKPVGSVVAIHGPWGSGKSSAVNLVCHHLAEMDQVLKIVQFQCWNNHTEATLAIGMFQKLYAELKPAYSRFKRLRKLLRKLRSCFPPIATLSGEAISPGTGSFWGRVAAVISSGVEICTRRNEDIETLRHKVADVLKKSNQRVLVVIDDIDRLAPTEALVIFRTIKSAGRLPNVTYLLAYNREAIEKAVSKHYPSTGPHYLRKIIQADFDLPEPNQERLINILTANVNQVYGEAYARDPERASNMLRTIVLPEIQTPRDIHRLANAISVTYPAVEHNVDAADFLSLETLRLFRPLVYKALRANKSLLVGLSQQGFYDNQERKIQRYENVFLSRELEDDRPRLKDVLMRLFPHLRSVWLSCNVSDSLKWSQQRRACSDVHFDTYFELSLSTETIAFEEINALANRADDLGYVRSQFLEACNILQARGRTKASILLEEMYYQSELIPVKLVEQFLGALYSIADDLHVEQDVERGFRLMNNLHRLLWLTRGLLLDRTPLSERSNCLRGACQNATLTWLVYISTTAYHHHHPKEVGETSTPPEKCLMTETDAKCVRDLALHRIRESESNKTLIDAKNLPYVLFQWHTMAGETSTEVQDFCAEALQTEKGVAALARAFLGDTYIQSYSELGDEVCRKSDRAMVEGIAKLMDPNQFKMRLAEVMDESALPESDKKIVKRFVIAWDAYDRGEF